MRGPLRLPSTFFLDPTSTPVFFHHIPENYHNSPCWVFFKYFFWAKMAWNAIACETTDVSRENSIFPIFQKTWLQAILAKKKRKNKKTEKKKKQRFYGVRRSCRVREFYNMCTSLAVECDVPCGVRRILSIRGWYRDHRGKFRGQNQKFQSQSQPKLPGAHQLVGSVFPSSPWVRPRGRNWLIFIQPTFKNVTFDNPVLLR